MGSLAPPRTTAEPPVSLKLRLSTSIYNTTSFAKMPSTCLALLLFLVFVALDVHTVAAVENVLGGELQKCSGPGMALTGFTRNGRCMDHDDDAGSHHVCIDMSSNVGGNFCKVTGQPDWCSSSMKCDGAPSESCPVEHWCVCEWAFAGYIKRAGGCDKIQKIVCEATNMKALTHYEGQASQAEHIAEALECLRSRCTDQLVASTQYE